MSHTLDSDKTLDDTALRAQLHRLVIEHRNERGHIDLADQLDMADEILALIQSRDRQLEQRVLETVGEDEHYSKSDPMYALSGEPFEWAERNQLRAELRTKLKGVFNQGGSNASS